MSGIVPIFRQFLEQFNDTTYRGSVDLSPLIDEFNNYTPIQLKLSDPQHSLSYTAAVIILNICRYAPNRKYPLFALQTVAKIIEKDLSLEDTKPQLIALIHLTKLNWGVDSLGYKMLDIDNSLRIAQIDDFPRDWTYIANKTINHTQIRDLINESIIGVFGTHLAERILETSYNDVQITFVTTIPCELRGFSGFNTIYINKTHFDLNLLLRKDLPNELLWMDIVSVTLHQLLNVRIRQVTDNLNMSAPTVMNGTRTADSELGRIFKQKLFSLKGNWMGSFRTDTVLSPYLKMFLNAICCNESLPALPPRAYLYNRFHAAPLSAGIDVYYEFSIC